MFAHGCIIGWTSPALGLLASQNTPLLSGPLTTDQIAWVGSINCIGGFCGSLSFGYLVSLVGCKRATLFLVVPSVTFWTIIYFANFYHQILIGRLIGGYAGGGIQTALVLYVSEIANDEIRGRLGSIWQFLRNVGILIAYILGATVEYKFIPCICVVIPIGFAICFFMLPNTPQYHLRKGQLQVIL